MPKRYDDERQKRSWKEIDRAKDGSAHRDPDRRRLNPLNQARSNAASKVYKSKLDAFFDGEGAPPAHVKEKLAKIEDTSPEGKSRLRALKAIKEAKTSSALDDALAAYLSKWSLPSDYDVLSLALNCGDESNVEMAMDLLAEMIEDNRVPKHITLLEQRLRRVKTLADDPDLQDKAADLLKSLRRFGR